MTIYDLAATLDELLRTNDYAVFPGDRDLLKDGAMGHTVTEGKGFKKCWLMARIYLSLG